MVSNATQQKIQEEMRRAYAAREDGNEGRARACARRAAGFAIKAYFDHFQVNYPPASTNALDFLTGLQSQETVPEELRTIAGHLLTRVNPDHQLPIQVDLLAETEVLVGRLESIIQENR